MNNMDSKSKPMINISDTKKVTCDDMWLTTSHTFLEKEGMVGFIIDSMNDFYDRGISKILEDVFDIKVEIENERDSDPDERKIKKIIARVDFSNIRLKSPVAPAFRSGHEQMLTPNEAHINDRSYESEMFGDVKITATSYDIDGKENIREATILNHRISKIFCMVKSKLCHLAGKSERAVQELEGDPKDPGGFLIIRGKEWALVTKESTCFNQCRIFNNRWKTELQRNEFISKPGDTYDNSKQIILRYLKNENLNIEFISGNLKEVYFPFYIIFRLLGWPNDKFILDNILYMSVGIIENENYPRIDDTNIRERRMFDLVSSAFRATYSGKNDKFDNMRHVHGQREVQEQVVRRLHSTMFSKMDFDKKEEVQHAVELLMKRFDTDMLPHIGIGPEYRNKKLKFLGYMIHRMLLVNLGILPQTDRDSYVSKRFHTPGIVAGKAVKTHFNSSIVSMIKKAYSRDFKNQKFASVDLKKTFNSSFTGVQFSRLMTQSVTTSNKSKLKINPRQQTTNRTTTELIDRKNGVKLLSTLRMFNSSGGENSKNSARAREMRMPNASMVGYTCLVQSPEGGEKVGLHKQAAITCGITSYSSSEILKTELFEDKSVVDVDDIDPYEMYNYSKVFVNGDYIGCVLDSAALVTKYTNLRRSRLIDIKTTIEWDSYVDEVYFWIDFGRPVRPLMIVYNNIRDFKEMGLSGPPNNEIKDFKQGIGLTSQIINDVATGKLGIDDLITMKLIEYISPQEIARLYIAPSINDLNKHSNNVLKQYTHVDVPENMFGVAALTSPLANYNQTPRNTFQTAMIRQAGSIYAHNFPYRIDKNTFNQHRVSRPLLTTRINKYLVPNGQQIILAIMCYTQFNIEDSLIFSKATSDTGYFNGSWYSYDMTMVEKNEVIKAPELKITAGIKKYAVYSKLDVQTGHVPIGTIVKKNDVVIGKVRKLPQAVATEKGMTYLDQSVVYKSTTPAIVHNVIYDKTHHNKIIKIAYRSLKPVIVGNKYASRSAQKGVVGLILRQGDAPFTSNGMIPHAIMNPHGYPSRMTISQADEQALSKICAHRGVTCDGTVFRELDTAKISEELKRCGMDHYGRERLFTGMTGGWIEAEIYMGPCYYQLLQKLVESEIYVVDMGPTDIMTRQPLDGKSKGGGLKISELQRDVLLSHGSSRLFSTKFFEHTDDFNIYICRCGSRAIVNLYHGDFNCPRCGDMADVNVVNSSWSSKQTMLELNSMHIGTKYSLEPFLFYD